MLNFKVLSTLLRRTKTTANTEAAVTVDDAVSADDVAENSFASKYASLVTKLKTSNKKLIKKKAYDSTKYSHLVNQFFKSKQRTNEGLEIQKTKTFHELDRRIQLLIRVRLNKYRTYYNERKQKLEVNTMLRVIEKRKLRGFDFLKFKNLTLRGATKLTKRQSSRVLTSSRAKLS